MTPPEPPDGPGVPAAERSSAVPDYTGYLLVKLGELATIGVRQALEPMGVRPRHFNVLAALAVDESLSQQDVSRLLNIDPNVLVGVIDDLENQGFAERRRNPRDRRRHVVAVTPAGRQVIEEGMARLDAAEAGLLACVQPDELAVFRAVAQRLLVEHASLWRR